MVACLLFSFFNNFQKSFESAEVMIEKIFSLLSQIKATCHSISLDSRNNTFCMVPSRAYRLSKMEKRARNSVSEQNSNEG